MKIDYLNLNEHGLEPDHVITWGKEKIKDYEFIAECMECTYRKTKNLKCAPTIKYVSKDVSFCPDCGCALFWNKKEIKQ